MSHSTFEQDYLDYAEHYAQTSKRMADRTMVQFIIIRLGLVLVSASLPALTLLDERGWTIGAAVLVAVLTGLDTQFQWGEEWRHFRTVQLALGRARRDYDKRSHDLASGCTVPGTETQCDNFSAYFADVEGLTHSETEKFFKFRIAPWRPPTPES